MASALVRPEPKMQIKNNEEATWGKGLLSPVETLIERKWGRLKTPGYSIWLGDTPLNHLSVGEYRTWRENQAIVPVAVTYDPRTRRQYWWYQGSFYYDTDGLSQEEVHALLVEREEKRQRKIERAQARAKQQKRPPEPSRERIPDDVKLTVWERDGGRCVRCGGQSDLEYDHIIPVSKGGSSRAENLQLLCVPCNRQKGGDVV